MIIACTMVRITSIKCFWLLFTEGMDPRLLFQDPEGKTVL